MSRTTLKIQPRAPVVLHIEKGHTVDWYAGPYEAVPKRVDQVLTTKDKTMRDDVTVREIPHYQTANPYGETYIIGE